MEQKVEQYIIDKAKVWLDGNYDEETKKAVREMLEKNPTDLADSFYKDLEFGTGGIRGVMGPGTNKMNRYTVGNATQGLANYLNAEFKDRKGISIAVAYDSRNNNTFFADVVADVMTANGIKVYLFDDIRPTPELSFAIRELNCQSGIVITASHNPPEYNGYKVYWEDGGQVIAPHDKNIIAEVNKIEKVEQINFNRKPELIEIIGKDLDEIYLNKVVSLSLSPELVKKHGNIKIVYTPIHGTGVRLVPEALKRMGFKNILNVTQQDIADGNFPTVKSPNPEEPAALAMAIEKAKETGADLVMATDPDADRVGIAVRNMDGEFILLNGNQIASLLIYYILTMWSEKGLFTGKEYIVKTVVTTELISQIAASKNVKVYNTLTGFKYIADMIKRLEGKSQFIAGGEESYGYLVGDFVRDKDAVVSCAMIAETAVWAKERGKTLQNILTEIYLIFGMYQERLLSVVRKGMKGAMEIQKMIDEYRNSPPVFINDSKVIRILDYLSGEERDLTTGEKIKINLPSANVLQFILEDGSKISIRPSGTEPKIKFYFSVRSHLSSSDQCHETYDKLDEKLDRIISGLNLS